MTELSIYIAKNIINEYCFIYKQTVLEILDTNCIVKISYKVDSNINKKNIWTHDSPYVKILNINGDDILGEIINLKRINSNKYPLNIGETIWFKKNNIIEIPHNNCEFLQKLDKYITKEFVPCSGALFCVESDSDSDTDSDSTVSDSD